MVSINWKAAQAKLQVAQDGIPGVETFGALLRFIASGNPVVAEFLANNWQRYNLTTPNRLSEFVAQTSFETTGFTRWVEDLDYSVDRLLAVWPARFASAADAEPYAHNPEALGDLVYANRMGNDQPGDGFRYRGRGATQLTGRATYAAYAPIVSRDILNDPDLLADPTLGMLAAAQMWKYRSINFYVDTLRFERARQAINGGTNGLNQIAAIRGRLLTILL